MRFFNYEKNGETGLGVSPDDGTLKGLDCAALGLDGVEDLLGPPHGKLAELHRRIEAGPALRAGEIAFLPPVRKPSKILCIGLNYGEHSKEVGLAGASYPTVFARFSNGLVGHGAPMIRPRASAQFDYEGELAVIVGRTARHVAEDEALAHVAGYSIFNDGSLRDYQTKTSQWTMGKNFDRTAGFGPFLVTPENLPEGAADLRVVTRLNGEVMQDGTTADFMIGVAKIVSILSEVLTLEPGDVIATGTPSGVGVARKPPVFMAGGDVCEVEIEGLGRLVNPIADEEAVALGEPARLSM